MRAHHNYSEVRTGRLAPSVGADVSTPVAGYFKHRVRGGSVACGVEIRFGPPLDPITGEEMDRGWRWMVFVDGEPADFDALWPDCTGQPITRDDYRALCARREWARKNAPDSSYAKVGRKIDPLSTSEVLPF